MSEKDAKRRLAVSLVRERDGEAGSSRTVWLVEGPPRRGQRRK